MHLDLGFLGVDMYTACVSNTNIIFDKAVLNLRMLKFLPNLMSNRNNTLTNSIKKLLLSSSALIMI